MSSNMWQWLTSCETFSDFNVIQRALTMSKIMKTFVCFLW